VVAVEGGAHLAFRRHRGVGRYCWVPHRHLFTVARSARRRKAMIAHWNISIGKHRATRSHVDRRKGER
jgi:hypothetical protein